jgi:hypothetical protein
MIQVLEFIFRDFWTCLGFTILCFGITSNISEAFSGLIS